MTESIPELPGGWRVTTVQITTTTTYRVQVAHPTAAPAREIAAVGYQDFCGHEHPETAFAHRVGPDEVRVGRRDRPEREVCSRPAWHAERPGHDVVAAILEAAEAAARMQA